MRNKKEKNTKIKRWKKVLLICLSVFAGLLFLTATVPMLAMAKTDTMVLIGGKNYNIGDFSGYIKAATAKKEDSERFRLRAMLCERWLTGAIRCVDAMVPLPKSVISEEVYNSENFLEGNTQFSQQQGGGWRLGYAQRSIQPKDILESDYYIGGNLSIPARRVKSVVDDVKVRTIALDDGSGRGVHVFAVADSIGITNYTVREIRALLADFAAKQNILSINVFATHVHSSVDTMGIWNPLPGAMLRNWSALLLQKEQTEGNVDTAYMDFYKAEIAQSVREAVQGMQQGRLYQTQIGSSSMSAIYEQVEKKLGFDENTQWNEEEIERWYKEMDEVPLAQQGVADYIWGKRSPWDFSTKLTKLRFVPENTAAQETVIVNMAAHPYANGLNIKGYGKGDGLSGDYPYYMEQVLQKAGSNFIFFNGAVNGIYIERGAAAEYSYLEDPDNEKSTVWDKAFIEQTEIIGRDLGSIILALNMNAQEIHASDLTRSEGRSAAYRNIIRKLSEQGNPPETEVTPIVNVRLNEVHLEAENPFMFLVGKLNLARFQILRGQDNRVRLVSEIGYMHLGENLKIAMIPGEITPGLVTGGGDTAAENAISGKDFSGKSLAEIAGEDILVFGLANDAIGYIIPDNDYCMFHAGNGALSAKLFGRGYTHYQELFSLGGKTGSSINTAFEKLYTECNTNPIYGF